MGRSTGTATRLRTPTRTLARRYLICLTSSFCAHKSLALAKNSPQRQRLVARPSKAFEADKKEDDSVSSDMDFYMRKFTPARTSPPQSTGQRRRRKSAGQCGVDFLGFRFFHNRTILRRAVMLKISRKVRQTAKKKSWNPHNCKSILSYLGWFQHTDNYKMYQQWVKPYINVRRMKGVVRRESIKRCNAGKGFSGAA